MDSWSLTLLGGFELRPTDGAAADLPGQKDRALLALLAMAGGDVQSRERLAGLLWSEHGDRQARDSLKQALVRLRRCLGGGEEGALRGDRQSIALDRAAVEVDVLAFERLVRDGTLAALTQAAGLYRGDLLEGIAIRDPAFEDWLLVERQRLRQLFERALIGLMAQALEAGDRERAAEAARRLLQIDPLSEAAYRTLMQVHADEAQTAQALKLYETLRERLYRELGVAPEPATVALHDRIRQRRTGPAAAAVEPEAAEPAPAEPEAPPAAAARSAIAVLPFTNMSGDPEQRYYSDGMAEDIMTGLARFRSLLVIARNSAFQYRDRTLDVRAVGRELGAHYVVEGSVRRADDRIRVSVQLVDATTGNHLWANKYDHELGNLFALQDEVSQAIVATLEGRIAAGAAARARRKPTEHMDAYDYLLQARELMAHYDLGAAGPLLARAIEADPTYAEAYARRAFVVLSRYWAKQDKAQLEKAARLAQKALALDAEDEWANFAMGTVRLSMRQFDLAGSHYERILAVNPNNVTCATMFAEFLTYVGRPAEALLQLDETLRRDPFPPNWYWEIRGMALFGLGRYDEAIAAYSKMTVLHPWIQAYLVAAYVHAGRHDDATRQLAVYRNDHPEGSLLGIAKQEPYKDDRLRDRLIDGLRSLLASQPSDLGPAPGKLSIAVLPFTNIGGDPDQDYFADGLTEDIITDLSRVSALSVVARHTVFTLKGRTLHLQEVARDLNVDYILEGSVRRAEGSVRITAQLIDGASGEHRWAERYDRRLDDIFALQDEIAKSIVDVLRVTLLPAELETITRHPTADARAYEYYLMGRFFYLRGQSKRHLAIARDMYAKAAEIDPGYARAYAGMAICESYEAASHPDGSFEAALANSERALALDANLAEAYAAKGFALFAAVRFDEAAVEFERATRLDPGLFEAHFFHARNCHNLGLRAEAAALFARAAELRPTDFRSPGLLAWECKALGRREQCAAALRRCLARLEAEVKAHPDNADALVFGSSILVESGDSARAEDWLARAIILGPDDRFVEYNAALTSAMLGRTDAALDHLERAFSAPPTFRRRLAAWMKYDDEMGVLRDHPRFRSLMDGIEGGVAAVATPARPREAPAPTKPSIAVLPFVNLSGDPEQQYFSDGVTEDIITELSRFRTLFVIARNASFHYRGGDRDTVAVGRELGVRYLCEGSVRRLGDRLRISAQLIEAATGTHLWAENFDRDVADILAVQDDIVRAIATTLGYRLEAAGRERALRLSPEALSAYDLTLRSEALMLRHTKEDNAEAQRLGQQAIALDPKSALAHAQLAWTYCLDNIFGWTDESGETLATALVLAQRAVLLDDADCRARWLLGHVHIFRREYDEARAHLRTAIVLNPNDVEARAVYGIYLYAVGETDAALEQFDIVQRHNPFEFNWIIMCRGIALFTARRYDEALATLKRVHNPNNEMRLWLAASYAGAGCLPEARATLGEFLAVAEREMARFPGRRLEDWRPQLHRFVEYRDISEFDHLAAALQAAGLG